MCLRETEHGETETEQRAVKIPHHSPARKFSAISRTTIYLKRGSPLVPLLEVGGGARHLLGPINEQVNSKFEMTSNPLRGVYPGAAQAT
ncbi:hypothetical protein CEXT_717751 [Caerostris extrusa]|uniref:Uncharacterized protein n=1 Tax=Caerostris extrusa TaxID=172846 RepID=A0AAV4RX49_CAEEX|nr:hypothetical protein CEXT_717751 [Caerostris extrusa]